MTTLREAAKQAEPCRYPDCVDNGPEGKCTHWLLAECSKSEDYKPQRPAEPVALDWLHKWANQDDGEPETDWDEGYEAARRVVQIHLTAPPQRQPLTEEEMKRVCVEAWSFDPYEIARAIERAHGIKEEK